LPTLATQQVLGVGGFNSWRFKQPSLYFFDVKSDPSNPKFIKAITPTQVRISDSQRSPPFAGAATDSDLGVTHSRLLPLLRGLPCAAIS
jgi:hypothetical protein